MTPFHQTTLLAKASLHTICHKASALLLKMKHLPVCATASNFGMRLHWQSSTRIGRTSALKKEKNVRLLHLKLATSDPRVLFTGQWIGTQLQVSQLTCAWKASIEFFGSHYITINKNPQSTHKEKGNSKKWELQHLTWWHQPMHPMSLLSPQRKAPQLHLSPKPRKLHLHWMLNRQHQQLHRLQPLQQSLLQQSH